jgi:23S rRNA (uracil1939-C5)-methyltransferase
LPVFEQALQDMLPEVENQHPIIDFYSGVGTIGVPLHASALVESDSHNVEMAKSNTGMQRIKIIKATAEKSLDCVPNKGVMIVDPPRAGLHAKLTQEILHVLPEKILYLSCNPITQARDLALLQDAYEITRITGYNFFPRTPHIESLAILYNSGKHNREG